MKKNIFIAALIFSGSIYSQDNKEILVVGQDSIKRYQSLDEAKEKLTTELPNLHNVVASEKKITRDISGKLATKASAIFTVLSLAYGIGGYCCLQNKGYTKLSYLYLASLMPAIIIPSLSIWILVYAYFHNFRKTLPGHQRFRAVKNQLNLLEKYETEKLNKNES